MRIGIDARLLGGRYTGDRTYWRGLAQGLAGIDTGDDAFLLYQRAPLGDADRGGLALGEAFTWRTLPARSERWWSLAVLPAAAAADGVDVLHVQYTISPLARGPVVTTVHDISFRLYPDLFSRKDRWLLNAAVPAAVRRACRVIAVSDSTRSDIVRAYPNAAGGKVVVTPLAAAPEFQRLGDGARGEARALLGREYGIDGPYALAVGVLQPRKNLPLLLRAFGAARRIANFPHRLVVTGKRGWLAGATDDALAAAEAAGDVIATGYVPDAHLPLLYNCADLFCYPSLYEGFGLPPLEAMACGCPVAASRAASLPEVVGAAGLLLDPRAPGAWIDALARLLTDPEERARLSAAGLAQASRFDWRDTARLTLAAYRACHNSSA